jgi:hypothetical protein
MQNYPRVINSIMYRYCDLLCLLCLIKDKFKQDINYKILIFVNLCG